MKTAVELLNQARVKVAPETFFLVSFRHEDYKRLLENPELSPRGDAPFMLLSDKHEVTLLLDDVDWKTMRYAARNARAEGGFRMMTFDIELDFETVGFFALVAQIFADAKVPVNALSAFSRDHVLIKQDYLAAALIALRGHVAEIC